MVCLDVIFYVWGACSAKAFSLLEVYQNNIQRDPGAHDVTWMTFSMVWMRALPQYSQHSKSYKIASEVVLELMMRLGVIFNGNFYKVPWGFLLVFYRVSMR